MKNEETIAVTDELIVRYLTGEASPEEAMTLHDWLAQPDNRLHFESFQSTWKDSYPTKKVHTPDNKRAWQNIAQKIEIVDSESLQTKTRSLHSNFFLKVAAAITVILAVGIFTYVQLRDKAPTQINIATKNNVREIILPDNSHVIVSRSSSVRYAKNFEGSVREISLSGEGFFEVTHNADKPFVVHTGIVDVRVIGTAFNVVIRKNKTEVSVARGKVLVYTKNDSIYLESGQSVTIESGSTSIDPVSVANVNVWGYATHKFKFNNTALTEIFNCIEKSYPCSIEVQNEAIKNCKLTAEFENKSVEYIITLIAETLDLNLTKKGDVYVLEGQGCP